jgi:hypothetical protein
MGGVCMPGTTQNACGFGGTACTTCGSNSTCVSQQCQLRPPVDAGTGPECDLNDPNYVLKLFTALQSPNPRSCVGGCSATECCASSYMVCLDR